MLTKIFKNNKFIEFILDIALLVIIEVNIFFTLEF
jgi:hypothetical protein